MLIEAAQKMSPFEYFFPRHSAINLNGFDISQAKLRLLDKDNVIE